MDPTTNDVTYANYLIETFGNLGKMTSCQFAQAMEFLWDCMDEQVENVVS